MRKERTVWTPVTVRADWIVDQEMTWWWADGRVVVWQATEGNREMNRSCHGRQDQSKNRQATGGRGSDVEKCVTNTGKIESATATNWWSGFDFVQPPEDWSIHWLTHWRTGRVGGGAMAPTAQTAAMARVAQMLDKWATSGRQAGDR
ncbi:hypothetical protein C1H76_3532 [Elsinoe australis]|uniref:Uncharacterized protein n=1 Tax=Elsinoe australis TaxID=40998 RepID=A0A4U7B0J7_9PEZI|nr:hypothetical protein C1H76_3532 [Elsinoe australis]